ncbi:hypothetical protein D3C81_2123840 [compost metagenome]
MDLFAGRQFEGQAVDMQVHLELSSAGKLLGRVLEFLDQAGVVNLQAKGGQQFA